MNKAEPVPNATVVRRRWYPLIGMLVLGSLAGLALYHAGQLGIPTWRVPIVMLSFVWMCVTILAAHCNRPVRGAAPNLKMSVVIPSHNEDPAMLETMLASLDAQTVLPDSVYFIENGETDGNAERIFTEWQTQTRIPNAQFMYREEAGKRGAQVAAFAREFARDDGGAEVVVTVDGDTELDPAALYEGLKPFAERHVMAVAGLLIGKNRARNVLTRIVDLGFVSSFMNGRAAWSSFGAVAVNCGGLAFYRAWPLKKYLSQYANQTLLGREVNSGDDRMLTAFAALEGRTVFQETSVGYTLLPSNMSHLTRQRGRWWRSFWWGGLWLIRRFSPNRTIWWLVASQYITFTLYSVLFPVILVYDPLVHHEIPWMLFGYAAGISYLRMARTLAVNRPDQPWRSQMWNFLLLSPLVTLLNFWLCSLLQFWGALTFYDTGWRTRQRVEVGIGPEGGLAD